jgi:hypothetical protein
MILRQIESDTIFLKKSNIIDYSLLVGVHIPEIRKSGYLEFKKEDNNKLKIERIDSPENIYNNNMPLNTLRGIKSVASRMDSVKFKEKRFELFDEANKNYENSLNNKDFESEISHYQKNLNHSDSNPNLNAFDDFYSHAYKDVY